MKNWIIFLLLFSGTHKPTNPPILIYESISYWNLVIRSSCIFASFVYPICHGPIFTVRMEQSASVSSWIGCCGKSILCNNLIFFSLFLECCVHDVYVLLCIAPHKMFYSAWLVVYPVMLKMPFDIFIPVPVFVVCYVIIRAYINCNRD